MRILAPGAIAILLACLGSAFAQSSAKDISATEIVKFAPPDSNVDVREGACWTPSIAVQREGAWRCTIGNEIYDPCFNVPKSSKRLICGANPAKNRAGITLKLAGPPPAEAPTPTAHAVPRPWMFALANGELCYAMTGTVAMTRSGEPAPWSCSQPTEKLEEGGGAVSDVTPGKVWRAKYFSESMLGEPDKHPARVKGSSVAITKLWY